MTYPSDFQHVPDFVCRPSRRQFLKGLLGTAVATTMLPKAGLAGTSTYRHMLSDAAAALPSSAEGDEAFWELVKDQFPLRPGLMLMNAANLCPAPYPVIEAVFGLTRDIDEDASFQNRDKFGVMAETAKEALAAYLGAEPEEVVITRNTSEGNNIVINGLTLNPGDEVLLWEENHPSNNLAWDVRADRAGFNVKKVATPIDPQDEDALVLPFTRAITSKTRVLAFSHVSNVTGVALPTEALCSKAASLGIPTLIDGAQTFGAHQLDLHEINCDFFTGSAHKWFMGPKEAGVLYVRKDRIDMLWPSIVSVGWENNPQHASRKLGVLGQRDDARVAAMEEAVAFHNMIGKERVEKRIRSLSAALKDRLRQRLPDTRFLTPLTPALSGGVVVFTSPLITDNNEAFATLYRDYHIGCAAMSGGFRLCPHIYNTMVEIDKVVDAFAALV